MNTYKYRHAAAVLNERSDQVAPWMRPGSVIYLSEDKPREIPEKTPAWYLPHSGDIYICIKQLMESMHGVYGPNLLEDAVGQVLYGGRSFRTPNPLSSKEIEQLVTTVKTLFGLIQHEAAHSAWSHWMHATGDYFKPREMRSIVQTIMVFEELRIESRAISVAEGVTKDPTELLRHSFAWLAREGFGDFFETGSRRDIANAWALLYGRYRAKVVELDDVASIHAAAEMSIGTADLNTLDRILQDVIKVPVDTKTHIELTKLAREWLEIVGEEGSGSIGLEFVLDFGEDEGVGGDGDGESEDEGSSSIAAAMSKAGGSDDGSDGSKSKGGASGEEDGDDGDEEEGDGSSGDSGEGESGEDEDGAAGAGESDDGDVEDPHEVHAPEVRREDISHGHSETHGHTPAVELIDETSEMLRDFADTLSESIFMPRDKTLRLADSATEAARLLGEKIHYGPVYDKETYYADKRWQLEPSAEVRRQVMVVARELERIALPSITKQRKPHELPPGRVNMRQAVAASVDRDAGRATQAKPWKKTKRTHSQSKPTIVGVMTDISGSMGWAEKPTAEFGYVFANAAQRISAKTAIVAFGHGTEVLLRPGERLHRLRYRDADGGTEYFDEGAAALDGMLHLTELRNTTRLVMVASDGHLVRSQEPERAMLWIDRWRNAGVHVIWLGFEDHMETSILGRHCKDRGVIVSSSRSFIEAGMEILAKIG